MEGIATTNAWLKQLIAYKTTTRNRDEEEILGYRNVLNLVHENYAVIPVQTKLYFTNASRYAQVHDFVIWWEI